MEKGGGEVDVLSGEVEAHLRPYVRTFLIRNGAENIVGKALRFAIWSKPEPGNVIPLNSLTTLLKRLPARRRLPPAHDRDGRSAHHRRRRLPAHDRDGGRHSGRVVGEDPRWRRCDRRI